MCTQRCLTDFDAALKLEPRSAPLLSARGIALVELKRYEDALADFARAHEIEPKAAELDKTARWPTEIVAQMADLGFLGLAIPTEYGGAGLDTVSYVLVMEEVSRACASSGTPAPRDPTR